MRLKDKLNINEAAMLDGFKCWTVKKKMDQKINVVVIRML